MKLLFENWRDTSWETDGEHVALSDVIEHLSVQEAVDINALELSQQLLHLTGRDFTGCLKAERVEAASLKYPIIVVKNGGQYRFILDGNHRLQKAINEEVENIKARILDIDSPETPEVFKKMFGADPR
jgi:hypothetical protein